MSQQSWSTLHSYSGYHIYGAEIRYRFRELQQGARNLAASSTCRQLVIPGCKERTQSTMKDMNKWCPQCPDSSHPSCLIAGVLVRQEPDEDDEDEGEGREEDDDDGADEGYSE